MKKTTLVLFAFIATAICLGAARAAMPEAPTKGIGYHGEGRMSANTVQR